MLIVSYISEDGPPQLIFEGNHSTAQVKHIFDAVINEPEFERGVGLVIDATKSDINRPSEEIEQLARHMADRRDYLGYRLALVIRSDNSLQYGLARMFSTYAELNDLIVGIFTRTDEALRWLRPMNVISSE